MAINPVMPDSAGIDSEDFDDGTRTEERADPTAPETPARTETADAADDDEGEKTQATDKPEPTDEDQKASDAGKELANRKRGLEGRKQTIQQQINDLVRERGDTERETVRGRAEREALQRDIERLRDQRERLARGEQVEVDPRDRREPHDPRTFDPRRRPEPVADPNDPEPAEADYPDFAQYAKAEARWAARQEVRRSEGEREQRARQSDRARWEEKRQTDYRQRYETFAKANPDFESEIDREDLVLTAPMVDVIKGSALGPQILLHLARNNADIDRISRLHPVVAYGEMKVIETQLRGAHSGSPAVEQQEHSKAPRPIKPVAHTDSRRTADEMDIPDETVSDDEHFERMNKRDELLRKRGITKGYGVR